MRLPLWFLATCSLKPKNQPLVQCPRAAGPLQVRLRPMRGLVRTARLAGKADANVICPSDRAIDIRQTGGH